MPLELFWKVMHFGPRTTICLKYLEEEKKSSNRVYKLHNAHFLEEKDQQSSKLFEGSPYSQFLNYRTIERIAKISQFEESDKSV
jgi:hypothetical protein